MKKWMQSITGVLAIVGLGYIAGVGHSLVRTKPVILGLPTTPPIEDTTAAQDPDENSGESSSDDPVASQSPDFDLLLDAPVPAGMLTLRRAHELWNEGAYFIDSRLRHEYDAGHISMAAYLTATTIFTDEGETEMQSIPPDAPVVIYCLGGDECDASLNTKAILQQFGYTDLSIMGVGYDEWKAAGLPVDLADDSEEGSP